MRWQIRDAVIDDVSSIVAMEQATRTAAHWSAEQYESRIASGIVIVAELEGGLCGFLCARAVAGEWEIENVVVDGGRRRLGIGRALLQALVDKWNDAGGAAILLEVREANAAARALYESCGLRETGRRRDYYRDPVENAVLYGRRRGE